MPLFNSKIGTMKYYNFNGTLIVYLTSGLSIQCVIQKIELDNRHFQRISADFFFINEVKKEESQASQLIPLSKQQATNQYVRFKETESTYRIACEIWWRSKINRKNEQIISDAFLKMVEMELNIPYPVKVEQYFWRKTHFAFALS